MGKKLDQLFEEWVEKARRKPTEGHRATLANGATLLYFPASAKLEAWRTGQLPAKGQHGYGDFLLECQLYERYAQNAGLSLSGRRMQVNPEGNKYCVRWSATIAMQRAI